MCKIVSFISFGRLRVLPATFCSIWWISFGYIFKSFSMVVLVFSSSGLTFMEVKFFCQILSYEIACYKQLQGSSIETFMIIGKVASEAVAEAKMSQRRSFICRINVWLEEMLLRARLCGMQIAIWLLQVRKALTWWKPNTKRQQTESHACLIRFTWLPYSFQPSWLNLP